MRRNGNHQPWTTGCRLSARWWDGRLRTVVARRRKRGGGVTRRVVTYETLSCGHVQEGPTAGNRLSATRICGATDCAGERR